MNAVYKNLVVVTACMTLAAAAVAQDNSALTRQSASTNSTSTITLDLKTQPTLPWSDHIQLSGLFVDIIQPQQTGSLLNPATPAPTIAPQPLELQTINPIMPSDRDSGIKTGGPNLAFLRFSFP